MVLDFTNLPSLEDIFGTDKKLLRLLKEAGFTDIVPLMLLPEHSLPAKSGLSPSIDKRITGLLSEAGIERRHYGYKLGGYLQRMFEQSDIAPISALQVAIVRMDEVNFPMYAPLQIIKHLNDKYQPLAIVDLVMFGADGLSDEASSSSGAVASIRDDLRDLSWRLNHLGFELPGMPALKSGFQLQAVG